MTDENDQAKETEGWELPAWVWVFQLNLAPALRDFHGSRWEMWKTRARETDTDSLLPSFSNSGLSVESQKMCPTQAVLWVFFYPMPKWLKSKKFTLSSSGMSPDHIQLTCHFQIPQQRVHFPLQGMIAGSWRWSIRFGYVFSIELPHVLPDWAVTLQIDKGPLASVFLLQEFFYLDSIFLSISFQLAFSG